MQTIGYAAMVDTGNMVIEGWIVPLIITTGLFIDWTGARRLVPLRLVERRDGEKEVFDTSWLYGK